MQKYLLVLEGVRLLFVDKKYGFFIEDLDIFFCNQIVKVVLKKEYFFIFVRENLVLGVEGVIVKEGILKVMKNFSFFFL